MNILITGAAGFIGSHLADRFHSEGHVVAGIDNLLTGRRDNFGGDLFEWDICRRDGFYDFANLIRPDVVIHCAASYSDPNLWHRDIDTNVEGCVNVAAVAKHHDARLFYFQTALPPQSSYAISKIAGQQYLQLSAVPLTVFRLANMYGPRNVSGPIPTFYKRLTTGQPCTVMPTFRDMVYIGDLVHAVSVALDSKATGLFDICSGRDRPISELYWTVAGQLGIDVEPGLGEPSSEDVRNMQLDPTRAKEVLGWQASTPLASGVAGAVSWYERHGVEQTFTHLNLKEVAR